jgi:hypothetical protein
MKLPLRKGFLTVVSALLLASCGASDSAIEPEPEQPGEAINTMIVWMQGASYPASVTIDQYGNGQAGPIVFEPDYYSPEDDSWMEAHFYSANTEVPGPSGHEMRVSPADSTILGPIEVRLPFRVGFQRLRAGFTTLTFELIRLSDGQAVYGPVEVPVEVKLEVKVPGRQ